MRNFHDGEQKSNWEKTLSAIKFKQPFLRCHPSFFLTLVALAIVLILVGKGLFDISTSTRCNYSFENIVQTYHEILGRDPEIQELKISVNGLLSGKWTVKSMRTILVNSREGIARKALLRSDGGKFRIHAQRTSTGHRPCACGDFYDEQLQRCFIMNPNIVLWLGGYGSDQDGTFVSSLAVRLKGTVSPSAMYTNAGCENKYGPVQSLSMYSYTRTDTARMHAIYLTCKSLQPQLVECLLTDEQVLATGKLVFMNDQLQFSDAGAERNRLCADKNWCVTSITPQRILQSMLKMKYKSSAQNHTTTTHHNVKSLMTNFLSWVPSPVASGFQSEAYLKFHSNVSPDCGLTHQETHPNEVGGWNETLFYFRYLWRCKIHFAIARYGDGELAVMRGRGYASETDLGNWSFEPSSTDTGQTQLAKLMIDGFQLAREHSRDFVTGGMFVGLPFHFCAEGIHDFKRGGGGHDDWLMEYFTHFAHVLLNVDAHRFVYSWQWGHFNYPASMDMIDEMGARDGGLILICNEEVIKNTGNLPGWAKVILMVPGSGVKWFASHAKRIKIQAASIALASQNEVFVFSAGPLSNILIPLMWRTNSNNTYIDFGGTLDYSVHGIKTRPFHPDPTSATQPWLHADGSLEREQECHQTRWSVVYEPRVISLDLG